MSDHEISGKDALVRISATTAREIIELCGTVQFDGNTETGVNAALQLAERFAYLAYDALGDTVPDHEEMARRIMRKNGEHAQLKINEAIKSVQHLTEALAVATKELDTAREELATFYKLRETDVHKANAKAESAIAHTQTAILRILGFSGSGVALLRPSCAQQNILNDTAFYGQSPYVPAPIASGTGPWAEAYSKARATLAQLSLEEKVNLTGGASAPNGCSGNIPSIGRVGFQGMCLTDAGNGVRATDFVNGWPSGIHVGASWNKDLAHQRGIYLGGEFRAKGVNVALGPVAGPLGRISLAGRNWEGFSNDPYLAGALSSETVTGIQSQGVITSTKNSYILNHLLKTELGYQGFVVSDWVAQHAGTASANAGLDMSMPAGATFWGDSLTQAVVNGSVPESRIDDIATRILAAWYQMGQDTSFPLPGSGMPASLVEPHKAVNARNPAAKPYLLQGAIEGHVLVKNVNSALPLRSPKLLSLYGYSATSAPNNNPPSAGALGAWPYGAGAYANPEAIICGLTSTTCGSAPDIAFNGTLVSGGGSGAITPPYISAPLDALLAYAYDNDVTLLWDFINTDGTGVVDQATDACLVFINAWAVEGRDRTHLSDEYSDKLVNNIADQCSNTIVVVNNAGIRVVDGFYNHPNVTAIVYSHLPGQDSGRALVSILSGQTSPSGKLPYTVAKNESDYGKLLSPALPTSPYEFFPQANFTEGLLIDYRAFDALNIEPRFEFGFGLTYTTFTYSDLSLISTGAPTQTYPTGEILPGGKTDLWDVLFTATATVTNTGSDYPAAEIAQLYVTIPNAGVGRQLRGFFKADIGVGASVQVPFKLTRRDLSVWDVVAQDWKLQSGTYVVDVGASSRNLPLSQTITIPEDQGS
ncbi:hypothetical protein DV737_g5701, partial [Chaetothyriales sp. CBS 132003]